MIRSIPILCLSTSEQGYASSRERGVVIVIALKGAGWPEVTGYRG